MTADVPAKTFLELAARSRVVDPAQLAGVAARFPTAPARQLAEELIKSGDLTHFQAEKLLRGYSQGLALGPYRILAPLARGGMGTVYLARDSRLAEELGDDVLVALKVLPPKVAREEDRMLARFHREIDLGKRVNHPNVARTLAGGEEDGVHFLAMEYVPGKTIRQLVGEGGRMEVGEAARVFAEVATGLAHIHERGLIHRDLKPSNVMITPDGRVKLLDMGLSFAPGDPDAHDPEVVGGKGYIVGTMDYISPEQARNPIEIGPRSDLYSLGCALYYALTGTPPFPGGTSRDKIRRQRTLDPVPVTELNAAVPEKLARIIARLMAKNPDDRPADATEARELLLPLAVARKTGPSLSVKDAVGAVDRPDEHPELWVDPEDEPAPPRDDDEARDRAALWVALGVAGVLAVVLLVLVLIRRL
jgi:serine/threonine protein kinase